MSTFNGRRGVNVSQYIANLNTVEPLPTDDLTSPQDDLSLFATTDFFDFDMGDQLPGQVPAAFNMKSGAAAWQAPERNDQTSFLGDFNFDPLSNFNPAPFTLDTTSPITATSPTNSTLPRGEKRKASSDETARVAADEDKRRRNTAASARFRVKKKQREQALEKTAKEMTEKATMLETKVLQLEMENKWLKGLITERDVGGSDSQAVGLGKSELRDLYEKYRSTVPAIVPPVPSSTSELAKGVGTEEDEFEDDE